MKCEVCELEALWRWSDTHGIAVCDTCGAPYRLYHYENDKRVEKAPELMLHEKGLEICRRYWREGRRRVSPGSFDMGIGRSGESYSGATPDDVDAWNRWCEANLPKDGTAA